MKNAIGIMIISTIFLILVYSGSFFLNVQKEKEKKEKTTFFLQRSMTGKNMKFTKVHILQIVQTLEKMNMNFSSCYFSSLLFEKELYLFHQ